MDGYPPEQATVLEHGADPAVGAGPRCRPAEDPNETVVRRNEAEQHIERGGLAGAVGPEQRDELAGCDGQVDPVDGWDSSEGLADADELDGRAHTGVRERVHIAYVIQIVSITQWPV